MTPKREPLKVLAPNYTLLQPCRYGWFVCMVNDMQTVGVMFQGEACPIETNFLCSLLKPGDFVIDVGANVGAFSLAFASAVGPTGRIFAFEPQSLPYQCLVANTVINSLSHIIFPSQLAIGETAGEIAVPMLDPTDAEHGGLSLLDESDAPKMAMPLVTIDSMRLPGCALLKVDVEGMEPQVLRGAYQTIAKYRPILWVEWLDYVTHRGDLKAELLKFFDEHDYDCWHINTGSFDPKNLRRQSRDPFGPGIGDQNILAMPKGGTVPDLSGLDAKPFA